MRILKNITIYWYNGAGNEKKIPGQGWSLQSPENELTMKNDPISLVGQQLKAFRKMRGISMRDLATASELSVNTISLIERGKISPTITTLHKLAIALGIGIAEFFAAESGKQVIFTKRDQRRSVRSGMAMIGSLGSGLDNQTMEPLLVTLASGSDSGSRPMTHFGHEFAFCLEGRIIYEINGEQYLLEPGDSLFFEAFLPHRWSNGQAAPSQALVVAQSHGNDQTGPL
jgi:transcriptional regulator with XRE-family HTH domain